MANRASLDPLVNLFSGLALRLNSRRAYASHHTTFLRYCSRVDIDPLGPMTERNLCMALIDYVASHKVTSLATYVSGIANWYNEHGLGDLPRGRLYHNVQRGINNVFGLSQTSTPKAALTLTHLAAFHNNINHASFEGARDWLTYIIAFFALLRVSEYISPTLLQRHLIPHAWGLEIIVPFSKTSLQPVPIRLCKRADLYCPLRAYTNYFKLVHRKITLPGLPAILAAPKASAPLSKSVFITSLKARVRSVLSLDPTAFAGHSFRRGGTTAMFQAGVPETVIAAHGRWRSLAYRRYFDNTVNALLPTQLLYNYNTQ